MNQPSPSVTIKKADWQRDQQQIIAIRTEVFVQEQGVPTDIELDGQDPQCHHLLAYLGDQPIGTVRLLPDGRIGRLAVVMEQRHRGSGGELLREIIRVAHAAGMESLYLHAQVQTLDFYRRLGFIADGEEFVEAGIRHRNMTLPAP